MKNIVLALAVVLLAAPESAQAQQPTTAQIKFFETNIRPALVKYCYDCHSVEAGDSRAGLLVDSRIGLLQGGDNGPAVVPGDAQQSLLWEAINWDGYEMPPSEKMPASVIAKFKQWIDMGAPDPRVRELLQFKTKITAKEIEQGRKEHWAFQPPKRRPTATIDALVEEKLAAEGLLASEPADAYSLVRRIYFDLIGLPPMPKEIEAFVVAFRSDPDGAVKAKVDELLDRPQYGERWGRHWLDVARYAESSGSRNVPYPHAWRYRNYVIDSFNADTPYDRFITEQIAGDLLPVKNDEQWQKNLIATGFLAIGLKHQDQKNPRKFMSDMVDEQIDTMTQSVLGLTVACARCHDHKYDPIPADDYYALAGIMYSTKTYYGTSRIAQNHRPSDLLLLPGAESQSASKASSSPRSGNTSMAALNQRIAELDQKMANMRGKDRRQVRNLRNRLATQLAALNPDGSAKAFAMGVQDLGEMVNANLLIGGEVDKPAQEVPRGFVQVFGDLNFTVRSDTASGRLELAKAMTSKRNPLTARVMVNRIWMHLLGKPLVETPTNFGFAGTAPTNQALLDHLATRFMDQNWSIKAMIREIVLTETYQRSSKYNAANYEVDPDNKLLWRANSRQIDAESMRDAMLAMSGRIELERPSNSQSTLGRRGPADAIAEAPHRSVYLPIIRDNLPSALDLFDFPDPNIPSAGRSESIVPTQALYLMNGDFVATQAQGMAATLEQHFSNLDDQIRMAFLWAYGRPATAEERRASAEFFRDFKPSGQLVGRVDGAAVSRRPGGTDGARPNRRSGANPNRRGGSGQGARGGRGGIRGTTESSQFIAANNQTLAVFCQTLMASARFRILN